jgi:hypothetical protein
MVFGIIASVILLSGWDALPGPDPSGLARMLLLAVTVLAGGAIAGVATGNGVRAPRPSWNVHRRGTGRGHGG